MEELNKLNEYLSSLVDKKEDIKNQLESIDEDINKTAQKIINTLSDALVGKFVKVGYYYGIIHSIVDSNALKVMRIGLAVDNKLHRTCEKIDISEIKIVSKDEVSAYLFDSIKAKYETFIKE